MKFTMEFKRSPKNTSSTFNGINKMPIRVGSTSANTSFILGTPSFNDNTISDELISGLFDGDGTLCSRKATPNSFTWNIVFNSKQSSKFAEAIKNELNSRFSQDNHFFSCYYTKGNTAVVETAYRPIVIKVAALVANHITFKHRHIQLINCYNQWNLGPVIKNSCIHTDYLAGLALSDGYINIKKNQVTPILEIKGSLEHISEDYAQWFQNTVPGTRYYIYEGKNSSSTTLYIVNNKQVLAQVLLRMAQCQQGLNSGPGTAAIIASSIFQLKLSWDCSWGKYPNREDHMVISSMAFLIAHCNWIYKVYEAGGAPVINEVPLSHKNERHFRDPVKYERAIANIEAIRNAWHSGTSILDQAQRIHSTLKTRETDLWV